MHQLETERLLLCPFTEQDYALVLKISSDPDTIKYLYHWGHPGMTPEADTRRFLDYAQKEWAKMPIRAREFCLVRKDSGEAIGDGSVEYVDEQTAEIGWILLPAHRKMGYVTEMGRELLRFAFEEMRVSRVIAHCDARNAPSFHVMERLGMHLLGIEKGARPAKTVDGPKGDEMTWGMDVSVWKTMQRGDDT